MIIICAGMYRSGSTWLFNAARIIVTSVFGETGINTDLENTDISKFNNYIIKIHPFNGWWKEKADVILLSHRDLRDIVASNHRSFNTPLSTAIIKDTLYHYSNWKPYANYDMRYENMITDPESEVKNIIRAINIPANPKEILKELSMISFKKERQTSSYDKLTLLQEKHITDGRHGSWRNILSVELVSEIETEFAEWMNTYDYSPTIRPRKGLIQ